MKSKVSDLIARFFEQKGVTHAFGIIGSANAHIFDSIYYQSRIQMICNHHEQACTMAVQTYWKIRGIPTFALVTAGAGSSNAITGVLSAWADSIPCLIISGQENTRYIPPGHALRMYGIQGFDSPFMVSKITKYASRIMDPTRVLWELEKAWHLSLSGRPGPCWLDIPMNIQSAMVDDDEMPHYAPPLQSDPTARDTPATQLADEVKRALGYLRTAKRPLLWLGVGIRMAGAEESVAELVQTLGVPALLTWSAIDMMDSEHPLVVGRAGVYGQRAANFVLQSCDYLLAIGTRMAVPQVGYDISELCREAKNITIVDIDPTELTKYPSRFNHTACADAGEFIRETLKQNHDAPMVSPQAWVVWCTGVRGRFPWIGPEHQDSGGFINSYQFMMRLTPHLKRAQIVVTDMGTALLSAHQALSIKPPQRLLTSQGLGEMGFGLPAAIGASFASNRDDVLCLNCDGGMMLNLQELQTIVHHRLPIKIIIFNNDGYLMIKHTQKGALKGRFAGTNQQTGVTCPNFSKLGYAFGIPTFQIRTWEDFDRVLPEVQACDGPAICEVFMHPEQPFLPKQSFAVQPDGSLISPPLEDLSPLLPRSVIRENLAVPLHEKSLQIKVD